MEHHDREESSQRPEEAPSEQVPDDGGRDDTRDEAQESPGTPDDDEQATGNPDNAG